MSGVFTGLPVGLVATFLALGSLSGCQSETPKSGKDNAPQAGRQGTASAEQPLSSSGGEPMKIEVTSTAFKQGERIGKRHTGEGEDLSPPLAWKNLPEGTKELALICDDPDAPTPEPWVHWVIYKLPPTLQGLPEGVPRDAKLAEPAGALQGVNSWESDNLGYRGPMPPKGHGQHRYFFRLYALKTALEARPGMDKKALLKAMSGQVLGEGELMGTYSR